MDNDNLFALVHNGIIENYQELKDFLLSNNYTFKSQTDSEVIVNLINYYYKQSNNIEDAIILATSKCEGTFALGIVNSQKKNKLYCIKRGSPLLLGFGDNICAIASEKIGFANMITKYFPLENNNLCIIEAVNNEIKISTNQKYNLIEIHNKEEHLTCKPYLHWTLKEINDQANAVRRTLNFGGRIINDSTIKLGGLDDNKEKLLQIDNLIILGCGTSYNSGLLASYLLKKLCNFNTIQVIEAGNFCLLDIPKIGNNGFVFISQSGETKDLHRCLELINESTFKFINIGIINVVDSLIAREVDCGIYLNAGREIAVASTKAFTCQYIALVLLGCWFSQNQNTHLEMRKDIILSLNKLPYDIENILATLYDYKNIASYLKDQPSLFILGKGDLEAVSYEGSLKIKEIGYIHAQGYNSSALKHGPYSLIVEGTPIIILSPDDENYNKNQNILEEVKSRGAYVIGISNKNLNNKYNKSIKIPTNKYFNNLLINLHLQFIAYYLSISKDINPDMPRNLAKVVTVD